MNRSSRVGGAVLLSIALSTSSASFGALIDNGAFTTDPLSSLDWLDLTQTTGLSYNQVVADTGGWVTAGWRYATEVEVDQLFSIYVGGVEGVLQGGDQYTNALDFLDLLGITASVETPPISKNLGLYDDSVNNPNGLKVGRADLTANIFDLEANWDTSGDLQLASGGSSFVGSYLVRSATVVPIPAASTLFMVGIGMLIGLSKRK